MDMTVLKKITMGRIWVGGDESDHGLMLALLVLVGFRSVSFLPPPEAS